LSEDKNLLLFDDYEPNDWEDEWWEMPEYNNNDIPKPEIVVLFKFKCKTDWDEFHDIIKKYAYKGQQIFGRQTENKKSAWYPLREKASKFRYE